MFDESKIAALIDKLSPEERVGVVESEARCAAASARRDAELQILVDAQRRKHVAMFRHITEPEARSLEGAQTVERALRETQFALAAHEAHDRARQRRTA